MMGWIYQRVIILKEMWSLPLILRGGGEEGQSLKKEGLRRPTIGKRNEGCVLKYYGVWEGC
jgi:TfoX/Sxy family transcriptional regulator of competence genes